MTDILNTAAQVGLILCGLIVALFEFYSDEFKKGQTRHNVLRASKIGIGVLVALLGVVTWYCGNLLGRELQTTLELERAARLKVENKIRVREITPEQKAILSAMLKNGPRGIIYVRPKSFDIETTQYGDQLSAVLRDAGFDVRGCKEATLSWALFGAFLLVKDLQQIPPPCLICPTCLSGCWHFLACIC